MAANSLAAELVERVFSTRNEAHKTHWKTRSYAEHIALGDFYENVVDVLDSFIEKFQGAFGLLRTDKEEKEDKEEETPDNILKCLQEDVKWINKNRTKIAQEVPALENILDELVGLYLQTIYKLRFLS